MGTKSHSYGKLSALIDKLKEIAFDALVVTGDITTDAAPEAFHNARSVLFDAEVVDRPPTQAHGGRHLITGLDADPTTVILTPGNHDRLGTRVIAAQSRKKREFEACFGPDYSTYPQRIAIQPASSAVSVQLDVFDSTFINDPNGLHRPIKSLRRFAGGEYLDSDANWWGGRPPAYRTIPKSVRTVRQPDVRVAALHHHPISRKGKTKKRGLKLSEMEGAAMFRSDCAANGTSVVMFGHKHKYYCVRNDGVTYVCCPSTTEYTVKRSGFIVYEFGQTQSRHTLFEFKNGVFVAGVPEPL